MEWLSCKHNILSGFGQHHKVAGCQVQGQEVTKSGAFYSTRMSTLTCQFVSGCISSNTLIALHWRFIFEDVIFNNLIRSFIITYDIYCVPLASI